MSRDLSLEQEPPGEPRTTPWTTEADEEQEPPGEPRETPWEDAEEDE
jgi:hypothetical protein